jgi:hypothetical protein
MPSCSGAGGSAAVEALCRHVLGHAVALRLRHYAVMFWGTR